MSPYSVVCDNIVNPIPTIPSLFLRESPTKGTVELL